MNSVNVSSIIILILYWVQVLSMSMDLFIARTVVTKVTLVFRGPIDVTESQVEFPFIV